MPRSFLVKKPSSTRIPNYGQLDTRAHEMDDGSCGLCRGPPAVCPAATCDAACDAACNAACPRDRGCLFARFAPPLPAASPGTPLRDNQSLNLPRRQPAAPEGPRGSCSGAAEAPGRPARPKPRCPLPGPGCRRQPPREPPSRRGFSCRYCEKAYGSLGALKMHIRTHTLPCVCAVCGKAFSRPWLLQGHVRTHTGEKPYACPHCSRAFADRSNLRAHLQTHADVKKYRCRACAKTFSRMSLLARHEDGGCCAAS
ncbi:zinc finger protein SNAI3 [Dromaius novaehollandiae]|uniref:zinc finger protein SNAI3 n=1 Tax=Dromaius novaehollandiae TaxID=8790 RepID=UPI00311F79CC